VEGHARRKPNQDSSFGERLQRSRIAAGLTQEALARRSGMSTRAIGDLERSQTARPRLRSVELLASALDLTGPSRTAFLRAGRSEPGPQREHEPLSSSRGAPALPITVSPITVSSIPPDVSDLIGRDDVIDEGRRVLTSHASLAGPPLVVVCGGPGAGKSSLVIRLAHQVQDHFPDGIVYLDLIRGRTTHLSPGSALNQLFRSFDLRGVASIPSDVTELSATLRMLLSGKRLLLVLDNATSESQVRPLLPNSASCAVLIAARRRLIGLETAHHIVLAPLPPSAAFDLLDTAAGPERASRNSEAIRRIVQLCDGVPAALRAVAQRLAHRQHLSVRRFADQLSEQPLRLHRLVSGDIDLRRSMKRTYTSLSARQRRTLRLCSRLAVPHFGAQTAATLLDMNVCEAEESLDELIDTFLVKVWTAPTDVVRYAIPPLTRQFALARSDREDEARS
jgi:transcriptional regulator with XRE-family HTH domain